MKRLASNLAIRIAKAALGVAIAALVASEFLQDAKPVRQPAQPKRPEVN